MPKSEEHYRAVAEAATDAIITIDSNSTILIVNPATERIFGYSTEEMIGQPLTMLMPEYLRHLHKAGIARYLETGRKHIGWSAVQLPGLHKTGNEIPLEISFAEFTRDGRRFFTGIARDISERRRLQERQARLARHAVLHAEVSAAVSESEKSFEECCRFAWRLSYSTSMRRSLVSGCSTMNKRCFNLRPARVFIRIFMASMRGSPWVASKSV